MVFADVFFQPFEVARFIGFRTADVPMPCEVLYFP